MTTLLSTLAGTRAWAPAFIVSYEFLKRPFQIRIIATLDLA